MLQKIASSFERFQGLGTCIHAAGTGNPPVRNIPHALTGKIETLGNYYSKHFATCRNMLEEHEKEI